MPPSKYTKSSVEWAVQNPTFLAGDFGMETDTGLQKVFDGITPWNSLPYSPRYDGIVPAGSLNGTAIAFFGDSITNIGEGYPYYVAGLSKGQIYVPLVDSHTGYDSASLLGVITNITQATVKPSMCLVLAGSNDANSAVPVAKFAANMIGIFTALRKAGICPVLATIPPRNTATTYVGRYNIWLRRYAALNHLPIVDLNTPVVNPANGNWQAVYDNGDGIHPNNAGNLQLATAVVNALQNFLPPNPYAVQGWAGAPLNMSANANNNSQFLNNTGGVANGFTTTGGALGTWTTPADSRGFNWQQVVATGAVSWADTSAGAVNPGDLIYLAMRYKTASSGQKIAIQCSFFDAPFVVNKGNVIINSPNGGTSQPFTEAIFIGEFVVPAGAAWAQVNVSVAGAGTYSWAQPTLYDMTTLGLVS